MKLHEETRTISRSGDFPQKTFGIRANSRAFDILSSKIYNDSKLAIVRELSTNAYDAHVEAGNADVPFDVHLPNHLTPQFWIRDYGTGLSPEDMETVYTTYFESTRNDSDEFVGALGLGSKSPFSYTDQFAVTSWWNGTRYDYSAYKGEDGSPELALLNAEESDEPNGIRIEIGIQDYHHHDFARAAEKVYRFFRVRPNITGYQISIGEGDPVVEGDGFALYDYDAGIPSKISVVMGQVHYRVNEDKFTHGIGYNGRMVLYAEIGDVSIAASREELHYDAATTDWIAAALDEAKEKAAEELQKEIEGTPTKLAEIQLLAGYKNLIDFQADSSRIDCVADAYEMKRLTLRRDKLYIGKDDTYLEPRFFGKYLFIQCDVEKLTQRFKGRIRRFLQENGQNSNSEPVHFYLITVKDATVTESLVGEPTAKISELPDAIRTAGGGGGGGGPRCSFKRLVYSGGRMSDCWTNADDDEDTENGCTVPRRGYRVVWGKSDLRPDGWLEIAQQIGYEKVYGLPASRYEKGRAALELPDLETEARKWIKAHVKTWSPLQCYLFHNGNDYRYRYGSEDFCKELLGKMAGLSDECDAVIEWKAGQRPSNTIRRMIQLFGIEVPKHELEDPIPKFLEKYPLLSGQCDTVKLVDEIVTYIQAKEAEAETPANN